MHEPTFFDGPDEWRAWLQDNHASATECVVGFFKAGSGRAVLTNSDAIDQALCFGWVDGVVRGIDTERYAKRFTPRKPGSIWSHVNVAKVERLRAEGLMTAAGEAAYAARREDRTGVYSFETRPKELSDDDRAQFPPQAWEYFAGQAPSYRRAAVHWVTTAKRPETRVRRLETLIAESAEGRWLKHLRRDR